MILKKKKFSFFFLSAMNLENPDSEIVFYVLLRAVDRFYKQYNRYPGSYDDQVDGDSVKLKVRVAVFLTKLVIG